MCGRQIINGILVRVQLTVGPLSKYRYLVVIPPDSGSIVEMDIFGSWQNPPIVLLGGAAIHLD